MRPKSFLSCPRPVGASILAAAVRAWGVLVSCLSDCPFPPPPFPGEEPGSLPEVSRDPSASRGQQGRPDPPSTRRPGRHGPDIPQLGRQSWGAASGRCWGPWPEGSGQGVPSSLWRCFDCRPQIQGRSREGAEVCLKSVGRLSVVLLLFLLSNGFSPSSIFHCLSFFGPSLRLFFTPSLSSSFPQTSAVGALPVSFSVSCFRALLGACGICLPFPLSLSGASWSVLPSAHAPVLSSLVCACAHVLALCHSLN